MQDRVSAGQDLERLEAGGGVRLRFRRAPLAAAAVWFAVGIGLARMNLHETVQVVGSLGLLAVIAVGAVALAEPGGVVRGGWGVGGAGRRGGGVARRAAWAEGACWRTRIT